MRPSVHRAPRYDARRALLLSAHAPLGDIFAQLQPDEMRRALAVADGAAEDDQEERSTEPAPAEPPRAEERP
eukprot:6380188-Prymnesium_polylepis.1